ncbi:MAG: response regulator [Bacteroidetes bacterium]|nr:MAG: response regulator [Bacteroidota bacterium]
MENPDTTLVAPVIEQPQYHWNNKLVLITEDEEVNFFYLKTLLKKTEARVIRAKNGKEAVDLISEHQGEIDLVLMDINMPVMDGYEAMRIIKALYPGIPIIAQTAYTLNNDRHKCLQAGFNDYIAKPINRVALFRMVNENLL